MLTTCQGRVCGWSGSLFDCYAETKGYTPDAALRALRRAKVRVPRATQAPRVLGAWMKARDAYKALQTLAWRMGHQHLPGPYYGHHLAALGLTDTPHHHPLWWTSTPMDIDALVGRGAKPSTVADRRLGVSQGEEMVHPTLVIPLWETEHILAGFLARHPSQAVSYTRLRPGAVGLGFLHTRDWRFPAWGDRGVITTNPTFAVQTVAEGLRLGQRRPVVYLPPEFDVRAAARLLAGRPWTMIGTSIVGRVDYEERGIYDLMSLLDASWSSVGINADIADTTAGIIGPRNMHWADAAAWVAEKRIENGRVDRAADLLRTVGNSAAVLARMSHTNAQAARAALQPRPAAFRTVAVEPGLTIAETPAGWVWDETGEVVAPAYPAAVKAARVDGRVRHTGVVVHAGAAYPFATTRLRRDPAAVVEAVLLRNGVTDPPAMHPRVVPHVAAVATYFSKPPT